MYMRLKQVTDGGRVEQRPWLHLWPLYLVSHVEVSSGSELCKNDTKDVVLFGHPCTNDEWRQQGVGILTRLHEDVVEFEIRMHQDSQCCCGLTAILSHVQQGSFPAHFQTLRYLFLTHADITQIYALRNRLWKCVNVIGFLSSLTW